MRLHPLSCLLTLALTARASQPTTSPQAASRPIAVPQIQRPQGETAAWWFTAGAAAAQANVGTTPPRAKNVIVFLGDGMKAPPKPNIKVVGGQRMD